MHKGELQEHVFDTYLSLRRGLVVVGAALPIVVWLVGVARGVELQGSISAYYWALPQGGENAPSRDWFVGGLFAVAACLYLYKGFTSKENVALNFAAVFATAVAVFPTARPGQMDGGRFSIHGASAILMFACLVYVVWFRSGDTLTLLREEEAAPYRKMYKSLGLVLLASPLSAFVLNSILGMGKSYIFFIEGAGIWAFAAYWWAKSSELEKSRATRRALRGEMRTSPEGKVTPAPEGADPLPQGAS